MDPLYLPPGLRDFVEDVGIYCERYDLPRVGGRILGLFFVTERPLSLDDMATALGVSRASVSTNVRLAVSCGMAERVSLPGDRRDYYRLAADAWEQRMRVGIEGARALRDIAARGLAAVPADGGATRERITEMQSYCDFSIGEMGRMLRRWRKRCSGRTAPGAAGPAIPGVPEEGGPVGR